jgi:hypothetical protein
VKIALAAKANSNHSPEADTLTIWGTPNIGTVQERTPKSTLGEYLGASAEDAWADSPMPSAVRVRELEDTASGQDLGSAIERIQAGGDLADAMQARPPALDVPIADAKARVKEAGLDPFLHLPDQQAMAKPVLDIMMDRAETRKKRATVIERGPDGIVPSALFYGTSFLVSAVDPLNIASAFIPVVGEMRYANMLANAGESLLARAAVRAKLGAIEGVVGQAMVEPLVARAKLQEGQDYTAGEALRSLMFGGVFGAGLHVGAGGAREVYRARRGEAQYPYNIGEPLEFHTPWDDLQAARPSAAAAAAGDLPILPEKYPGELPTAAAPRTVPAPDADRRAIFHDARQQLEDVGMAPEEAAANAAIVAARYSTRAERLGGGASALDLYRNEGVKIGRGADADAVPAGATVFGQDAPAFREWSGGAPVVKSSDAASHTFATGKPVVVEAYHGTNNAFEVFDPRERGTATGAASARMGDFTASNPKVASSYADTTNPYTQGLAGAVNKATGGRYQTFNEKLLGKMGRPSALPEGGSVMPVYVRLNNPMVVDFAGKAYREKSYAAVIAEAKAAGHDGVILRNTFDEGFSKGGDDVTNVYVSFEPTQIKSKFNRGTFDPNDPRVLNQSGRPDLFAQREADGQQQLPGTERIGQGDQAQRLADQALKPKVAQKDLDVGLFGDDAKQKSFFQSAPTFYSAVERAIESVKQEKAPAGQWLGTIKNLPGVKPEEIEWLGLADWLGRQEGAVTKQQVLDYVRANKIELKEVTLAEGGGDGLVMKFHDVSDQTWRDATTRERIEMRDEYKRATGINSWDVNEPKYERYQLPGGENYRELLLTLPDAAGTPFEKWYAKNYIKDFASMTDGTKKLVRERYEKETGNSLADMLGDPSQSESTVFRSSHWDEPNVLAHVRLSDRVIDGKKTLLVEEVQSDWHQSGKKHGYSSKDGPPDEKPGWTSVGGEKVPDAPFKTTWPELAMKRMIRYAAENGYERIAWTPGAKQAERYDLSKQIKSVEFSKSGTSGFTPRDSIESNTRGMLVAYDHSGKKVIDEYIDQDRLPDYVGKDVAEKLLSQEGGYGNNAGTAQVRRKLEGLDLKVGGEGMVGFYDDILPKTVNKLVKKYDAKVGQGAVEADAAGWHITPPDQTVSGKWMVKSSDYNSKGLLFETEAEARAALADRVEKTPVHVVDITPALREAAVEKGFPLFQGGETPRGQILMRPGSAVIKLFQSADRSTFMHESGHLWLDELIRDASRADAPEGLQQDLASVLQWLNVKSADDIGTAQHEQWARGFEQYLRTGNAPTGVLAEAFARFKEWLTTLYRNLTELGEPLPAEIRGVMDRMLATDAEIARRRAPMLEALQDLPRQAQEDAMRAAIASVTSGEPVRVMEMLEAAAQADPRIAESMALAAPGAAAAEESNVVRGPKAARGPRARDEQTFSLIEFLADRGGLRPDPELAVIFGGKNPFVPGFGRLIRKTGMTLDRAREASVHARYLADAGERDARDPELAQSGPSETTPSDLLSALDEEARGRKQYRNDYLPDRKGAADRDEHLRHLDSEFTHALREVDIDPQTIPDKQRARVIEIMEREGETDPIVAWERAVMEQGEDVLETAGSKQSAEAIPGWDVPDVGGPAPGAGGPFASGRIAGAGGPAPAARVGGREAPSESAWRELATDRRPENEPEAVAASREADALPEPGSNSADQNKRVAAAEKAAADADARYADAEAHLPEDLRRDVDAKLKKLDQDARDGAEAIQKGAACLAAAVA